jgi:hypothetical protein
MAASPPDSTRLIDEDVRNGLEVGIARRHAPQQDTGRAEEQSTCTPGSPLATYRIANQAVVGLGAEVLAVLSCDPLSDRYGRDPSRLLCIRAANSRQCARTYLGHNHRARSPVGQLIFENERRHLGRLPASRLAHDQDDALGADRADEFVLHRPGGQRTPALEHRCVLRICQHDSVGIIGDLLCPA